MSSFNSLLFCIIAFYVPPCIAKSFSLNVFHRYSEKGQEIFKEHGQSWPVKNTQGFHDLLFLHDKAHHGRMLQANDPLIFSQGNLTVDLGARFGWIHYALVDLGTPNITFLVALDTGSDLFWVPCECQSCSTINPNDYPRLKAIKSHLSVYTPSSSTTSSPVNCSDSLCELGRQCSSPNQQCPYNQQYLDNSGTSGVLVKDIIYLAHENNQNNRTEATITFGCGQVQKGLDTAFDGLMGLGMGQESLPSVLSKAGLAQNSFSMCFSNEDYSGRIIFGDTGFPGQKATSFISNAEYLVSIEGIQVGVGYVQSKFKAVFDTGTTFTYLPAAIYNAVTTAFDQQIQRQRVHISTDPLYNFCYRWESSTTTPLVLKLNFTGAAEYEVFEPYIYFVNNQGEIVAICLAVLQADIVSIIGQNFMSGYRVTFNRETHMLGWVESDCYNMTNPTPSTEAPPQNSSTPSPESTPSNPPGPGAPAPESSSQNESRRPNIWYIVLSLCVVWIYNPKILTFHCK